MSGKYSPDGVYFNAWLISKSHLAQLNGLFKEYVDPDKGKVKYTLENKDGWSETYDDFEVFTDSIEEAIKIKEEIKSITVSWSMLFLEKHMWIDINFDQGRASFYATGEAKNSTDRIKVHNWVEGALSRARKLQERFCLSPENERKTREKFGILNYNKTFVKLDYDGELAKQINYDGELADKIKEIKLLEEQASSVTLRNGKSVIWKFLMNPWTITIVGGVFAALIVFKLLGRY